MQPALVHIPASRFAEIGSEMARNSRGISSLTESRRFREFFGVTPLVCSKLWDFVAEARPPLSRPVHLLWSLLFLKVYGSERTHSIIAQVDGKTFRKWSWCFVHLLADLDIIKWENRLETNNENTCNVSVDGTDFSIYEPTPFSPKWYSHKFKGPGLRYEVAVCIKTGHIVWTHGPFPCGAFPDLTIFRLRMKNELKTGEKVVADGRYKDNACLLRSDVSGMQRKLLADIRARQETVNRRFKQFFILGHRFRHDVSRHSACFYVVARVTQLMIELGNPLFVIDYAE